MRFCVLLFLFLAPPAQAGNFYVETDFGISKVTGADQLFGAGAPRSPSWGFATNLNFGYGLNSAAALLQFHIGLKTMLSTAPVGADQYWLLAPYPMLRLEFGRLYIGGGATILAWTRAGEGFKFTPVNPVTSPLLFMLEAGTLWRVTPFFHLAVEATAQFVTSSGAMLAAPIWGGTINMRFIVVGKGGRGGGGSRSSGKKLDGWRYPFGLPL